MIGQQLTHCEHPFERDVVAVDLFGARGGGEVAGVLEGHRRGTAAQRQTGGDIQPVDAGPGVHIDLHGAPAVAEGSGLEAQPGEGDAFSAMVEVNDARAARGEGHRSVRGRRPGSLQQEDPVQRELPWRRWCCRTFRHRHRRPTTSTSQGRAQSVDKKPGCPVRGPPGYCAHPPSER